MARSSAEVELALDAHAEVGEGPCWDAASHLLVWVDITRGQVHRFDPGSGQDEILEAGQEVGAAAPRAGGGLVLALRDGFALLDPGSRMLEMIADTEGDDPGNRMNDGKCDRAGNFWAGTMAFEWQTRPCMGALYKLAPDRSVTRMLGRVTLSNGLGWSPDGRAFYYIDSATQGIDVFDHDPVSGRIGGRRRLVDVPKEHGLPDGLCVDAEGYLWVALWGGWTVRRYTPAGAADLVLELPVSQPSCPAFGGDDLGDLYITTAAHGLSSEQLAREPHAGGLFRVRPGVHGQPSYGYRG